MAATLTLRRRALARVRGHHPWVYRADVASLEGDPGEWGLVRVVGPDGAFVGAGYYNERSRIRARILTWEDVPIDRAFVKGRIARAVARREGLLRETDAARLVFSEGDGMSGLIVDRYGSVVVVQILTMGFERMRDWVVDALVAELSPACVWERSDVPSRAYEGLGPREGLLWGALPGDVEVVERGVFFAVDVVRGQKTGFFLDQRETRSLVRRLAEGRRVLDCFCYSGGFAVNAAVGGATEVVGIDQSEEACEAARRNAARNGVEGRCRFVAANAFDYLSQAVRGGERFDMVVLDPPAFTRSRASVGPALRGYKEINLRAMKLLTPGGVLVTCSCSHHISHDLFAEVVASAAVDVRREARLLASLGQPLDHPVLLNVPETSYLKVLVLEVA